MVRGTMKQNTNFSKHTTDSVLAWAEFSRKQIREHVKEIADPKLGFHSLIENYVSLVGSTNATLLYGMIKEIDNNTRDMMTDDQRREFYLNIIKSCNSFIDKQINAFMEKELFDETKN